MNMGERLYRVVLVLLGLLVLAQLAFLWRGKTLPPLAGPMIEDTLPTLAIHDLNGGSHRSLGESLRRARSCSIVFAIDPNCSVCARMRYTWPALYLEWRDSVGTDVPVFWLGWQEETVMGAFIEDFDLPGVTVATVFRDTEATWRRLGVYGTPVSYLVDREGRVQAGVAGPQLPPAELARVSCVQGR